MRYQDMTEVAGIKSATFRFANPYQYMQ